VNDDPLLLTAFALWCFTVALAGGLAGLVLGNIRLPFATHILGGLVSGELSRDRNSGREAHRKTL
jgi:hypothetical protein